MNFLQKFEKIIESEKKRYLISFIVVSIILLLCWLYFSVRFETNDDSAIMYNIAGYRSGQIEIDPIFSGVLWGIIVGIGYYFFPQIPWYTILSMAVIGISHVIVLEGMLRRRRKSSTIVVYMMLFLGVALYSAINLQFTTTAMWPGIAANILSMDLFESNNKKENCLKIIFIAFLLLLCCNIRKFVGISAIGFFSITLFINGMNHLSEHIKIWRRLLLVLGIALSMLLLTIVANSIYESDEEWKDWREYHKERSDYTDYVSVSYDEIEEIYGSVGWSVNLYNLVHNWFFMDPKINKDSLQILNQYTEEFRKKMSFKELIYEAGMYLKRLWIYIPVTRILILSEFGLLIYIMGIIFVRRDKFILIKMGSVVCGSGLMIMYLCLKGRLPLRAFQVCIVPSIVILYTMVLEIQSEKVIEKYIGVTTALIGVFCLVSNIHLACNNRNSLNIGDMGINLRMNMETYAIQHPENIYVYDATMSYGADAFVTYPVEKPTNYIFWGGSTMFSPIYERQIKYNGRNTLYADAFLEENVYFVSLNNIEESLFIKYMQDKYGNIGYQLVESIDDCQVYKLFRHL